MSKEERTAKDIFFGDKLKLVKGEEPIPGFRLDTQRSHNVWAAIGPKGPVAIKSVANDSEMARGELQSFRLIKDLRHPNLVELYDVHEVKDRVVVVMELCERSLDDVRNEYEHGGQQGIPRTELLAFMADAALGLDFLNGRSHSDGKGVTYGIQHCDIRPGNLLLKQGRVKIADCALATALTTEPGKYPATTSFGTPPEGYKGRLYNSNDQFALAVTYCYLLNRTCLAGPGTVDYPAVKNLPESDRDVVSRAIDVDPSRRWPSCTEFVARLRDQ